MPEPLVAEKSPWWWFLTGVRDEPAPSHLGTVEPPDEGAVGVCCSGGGIRSAAFNLGALQALQDRDTSKGPVPDRDLQEVAMSRQAATCIISKQHDLRYSHPVRRLGQQEQAAGPGRITRRNSTFATGAHTLHPTGSSKLFLALSGPTAASSSTCSSSVSRCSRSASPLAVAGRRAALLSSSTTADPPGATSPPTSRTPSVRSSPARSTRSSLDGARCSCCCGPEVTCPCAAGLETWATRLILVAGGVAVRAAWCR